MRLLRRFFRPAWRPARSGVDGQSVGTVHNLIAGDALFLGLGDGDDGQVAAVSVPADRRPVGGLELFQQLGSNGLLRISSC